MNWSTLTRRVSCPRARSSAAEQETLNLSVVGSSPTGLTKTPVIASDVRFETIAESGAYPDGRPPSDARPD
jgi:hypothetical protein